jgi:thiamine pyrophosphate-dependent acetolactate synthase large subunit-like protein
MIIPDGMILHELAGEAERAVTWTASELNEFKALASSTSSAVEPRIVGLEPPTPTTFFSALRQAMPADSCLVTDTGLHQGIASRHFQVSPLEG